MKHLSNIIQKPKISKLYSNTVYEVKCHSIHPDVFCVYPKLSFQMVTMYWYTCILYYLRLNSMLFFLFNYLKLKILFKSQHNSL